MKTKLFFATIVFFIFSSAFSQVNLNNYKYVIVPKKFDFLNKPDQYQLNSLTKFLFEKYGFKTLSEGDNYPEDMFDNRCLSLKSDVLKDTGLFKTKLTVELKDCNDKVVFTSDVGESKEKEYKTAYNLALREAFQSVAALHYKYEPISNVNTRVLTEPTSSVSKQIQSLPKETKPIDTNPSTINENTQTVVINNESDHILYAQAISGGFQIVDSTPKVIMVLIASSLENIFIVKDKNAIVFNDNGLWYYSDNASAMQLLHIKF